MKAFIAYFVKNLVKATQDNYAISLFATVKLSVILTPVVYLYDKLFKWGFEIVVTSDVAITLTRKYINVVRLSTAK